MQPYELTERLNVADNIREQFGSHWDQRRYDHFVDPAPKTQGKPT